MLRPSARILAAVDDLPLRPGMRVLEVGCGPGSAAREVALRLGDGGFVLGIDRSAKAIAQAVALTEHWPGSAALRFRHVAAEDFELAEGEAPFDLAFALRVGALDGRHPEAGRRALGRLGAALAPGARLFIDGGNPLREIRL